MMNKRLGSTDTPDKLAKTKAVPQGSAGKSTYNKLVGMDQTQASKAGEKKDPKLLEKELSSEEKLALIDIKPIEKKALAKAFRRLCRSTPDRDDEEDRKKDGDFRGDKERDSDEKKPKKEPKPDIKEYFTAEDVAKVLDELKHSASKPEIESMIWEVDENLDKRVDKSEFELMFKRCIEDQSDLEPKSLFNLVQFLMYAKEDAIEITEEDTLEQIYVRKNNIDGLEKALAVIFGKEEKRSDGIEKKINFTEFLDRRNAIALENRRKEKQAKKDARSTLKKDI